MIIVLSSCSETKKIRHDFFKIPNECEIKVEFDGAEYVLGLNLESDSDITLTFIKPENLRDMQLCLKDGNTVLKYHGVDIKIDGDYAKNNGLLLLRHIFLSDKKDFDSASIVKISGVKYCRQRYKNAGNTVDIYFTDESELPYMVEAEINGRSLRVTFVNE